MTMTTAERGSTPPHQPVLYQEILDGLSPKSPKRYVDATLGAGGHARGILEASSPHGLLLGFEVDPQALAITRQRLSYYQERVILIEDSYTTLREQLRRLEWNQVDGIVLDLGVSSMQLDTPERGFSFQSDAPLDMRFSPSMQITAAELVNHLPEAELAALIWRYGEDPHARRIARSICLARPLETTRQLANTVVQAVGGRQN
ncbi:MAG: 16S rRNA (cytosine(1402)-N(4))-methyltransferase RsmH, partial [Anaerolineaceae bacterium]|nr:16S rRNA (cytosine(1402)-N(4))-methyltransferase RsmH [Anaerolineaceae bacterium]